MILRIDGGNSPLPVLPTQHPATDASTPASSPAARPSTTATSTPTPTPTPGQLAAGARLTAGQSVRSANGRFELTMQRDGNLVETDLTTNVVVWASRTNGSGASYAEMQRDGNLVLYRGGTGGAAEHAVWSSSTSGHTGAWLSVQNDGNVVVYPQGAAQTGHDLWSSGVPLAEVPGTLPALPQTADAPQTDGLSSSAIGVFAPGAPELGIQQTPLVTGSSPYDVLQQQQVFAQPKLANDTPLLDANLAATPSLDRQPFGTRPANPVNAVYSLPPGTQVTVLDPTRLGLLEQERTQLGAAESAPAAQRSASVATLSATIYQELTYAGTRQSVPDSQALAASIRARAPQDATFQQAVDDAVKLYDGTLNAQGRTKSQLGAIDQAAAAGNWAQVRALAAQQITATVGKDQGSTALGDITARGSVYLTYAGGDPHFAQAIQAAIGDARKSVLIDRPVASVLAAYQHGGAAAAMQTLANVTDPQTATPAQVAQIMADARVQTLVKQVLHGLASYQGDGNNAPSQVIDYLSAACEHATESDQGTPGLGKAAVDRIATYFVAEADGIPPGDGLDFFQDTRLTQQVFADSAGQGNVSLALAVASQANRYLNPIYGSAALDGVRQGLDALSSSVSGLDKQTAQDAAFLSVPISDWGGDSTPAQQQALIQKLLADNPADAQKLNDDGNQIAQMQETTDSVRMAVAEYSSELHGVTGFDVDAPTSYTPGQYDWQVANTPSVTKALAALPTLAGAGKPGSTAPTQPSTNTLWLQRSLRKVVEQIGKKLIANLATDGPDRVLTPGGAKLVTKVWSRVNKGLGTVLYFQNAAYSLGEAADGGLSSLLTNGVSGIRQELAGVSYAMSTAIPGNMLSSIRPGSGATPLAQGYESLAAQIDELGLPKVAASPLKIGIHLAMQDTSDLASMILGAVEAGQEYSSGETLQGVGNTLNALGYAALLTGPGIDASELPAGATVLGLDATGWTGIGAVLVLAGAAIYTAATAYSHSHAYDGNDQQFLEGMGVHSNVAAELAKHATSLDGQPPSAGPFLAAYFREGHQSQQQMVSWLNGLTPKQADAIASAIKGLGDDWEHIPMQQLAQSFDNALFQYGVMPPIQLT